MPQQIETLDATCPICEDNRKGRYVMTARCGNCGWTGEVTLSNGHETYNSMPPCLRCKTSRVKSGEFVRSEESLNRQLSACTCGRPERRLSCRCICEKCGGRELVWVPVGNYLDRDLTCQGCQHVQDIWDC